VGTDKVLIGPLVNRSPVLGSPQWTSGRTVCGTCEGVVGMVALPPWGGGQYWYKETRRDVNHPSDW
jgi:hypothetical protein